MLKLKGWMWALWVPNNSIISFQEQLIETGIWRPLDVLQNCGEVCCVAVVPRIQ